MIWGWLSPSLIRIKALMKHSFCRVNGTWAWKMTALPLCDTVLPWLAPECFTCVPTHLGTLYFKPPRDKTEHSSFQSASTMEPSQRFWNPDEQDCVGGAWSQSGEMGGNGGECLLSVSVERLLCLSRGVLGKPRHCGGNMDSAQRGGVRADEQDRGRSGQGWPPTPNWKVSDHLIE